jgi:1,4-dihydroxy-6-naphthoate synthase
MLASMFINLQNLFIASQHLATMFRIAHTPDADDAFMFYAMVSGKIANVRIRHIVEDIETLNRKAFNEEVDVTALSAHAYAFLHEKYRMLSAGASVGDGYGPVVVAKEEIDAKGKKIAVPGKYTTANLLLILALSDFQPVEMRFDEIINAVKDCRVDAGLLIHEGQITYEHHGLTKILDLWEWWYEETKLPLPLGINVIRRSIPEEEQRRFLKAMQESIKYALQNVDEALQHAMKYSRGLEKELVKKFALMYVNDYTYEMTPKVIKALEELYDMAEAKGLFKKPPLDILF